MALLKPYFERPYRLGVGIALANPQGLIFMGKRFKPADAWQMPQGGIDSGEDTETAVMRELFEETGIKSAEIITKTPQWLSYDLPFDVADRLWNGQFRGQKQMWYLMRFSGDEREVNLSIHTPEFETWKWVPAPEVIHMVTDFKQDVYRQAFAHFAPFL